MTLTLPARSGLFGAKGLTPLKLGLLDDDIRVEADVKDDFTAEQWRGPDAAARALGFDIGARAFADGLICYPCSGNVDGTSGDTIIIAPPYNASDVELEEIVTKLSKAVDAALSGA